MQRAQRLMTLDFFSDYIYRLLALMSIFILIIGSNSAFALATNPGAVCSAGFSQGTLTNADYDSLFAQLNTSNYVDIAGDAAGSIPLQIRMTTSEANGPPTSGNFNVNTIGANNAFNIGRDFPSLTSVTSINLDFRNKITAQPIFLTNVAMSAFDIDLANSNNNFFDDYVLFTGINASGDTIDGTYQVIAGSSIRAFREIDSSRSTFPGLGLYILGNTANCPANTLNTVCQGSIQFSEPVRSVKVRYSNANFRIFSDPTNQEIDVRVDNYCYVPQYIFSGTVFNDNGGINPPQANANESNITTGTYNNTNYFNGVFDTPPETGINGSSVRLANCANTATTYPTQSVIRNGAPAGEYQISIPKTTLASNTNLCLVESRSGATFPIRTTTESRNVGFAATTYNYPNNDFGRVIAENAALVLRKAQYVNNCPPTLNYSDNALNAPNNNNPRTGFSEGSINGNLDPGQCIAYRITATNRANIAIDNFIMRDVLQKKGINNATLTSVLAAPPLSSTDYTSSENPAIGANGEVKTKNLSLPARDKRNFYFNTKYGTSSD